MKAFCVWDKGAAPSDPQDAKLARLVQYGQTPVRVCGNHRHTFYDDGIAPADTIGMTFKLLLPAG